MARARVLKWLIGSVVAVGVVIGLTFAYLEGRKERATDPRVAIREI